MHKKLSRAIAAVAVLATAGTALFQGIAVSAASPTSIVDTLDRIKISETASHTITATMPSFAEWTTVTIDYGTAGFTFTPGAVTESIASGTIVATASATGVDIVCTVGPCSGAMSLSGISGTNPGTSGSKTIAIAGDGGVAGQYAIAIVNDDQVSVTATVDPSITFNVGAQSGGSTACDGTYSGNGGTVALGTLSTGSITSSDVSSVSHICTRLSTNATSGAIVTVKSANSSLKSTAVSGDTIPSATGAMAAGTANYGLCDGDRSGVDTTTPASASVTQVSPYDGTCADDTAAGSVGIVDGTARTVWSVSGPTSNAYQNIVVKAAISGTTKAHSDYTDTLTFVATGTF